MNKLQSHSTSNVCTISQYAALAALNGDQGVVEKQRNIFNKRRDLVKDLLVTIKGLDFVEPHGAFYFFIDIKNILKNFNKIQNSKEFCLELLERGNVATVPGSVFGMEGYMRISYAKSEEEIVAAFERINKTITDFV